MDADYRFPPVNTIINVEKANQRPLEYENRTPEIKYRLFLVEKGLDEHFLAQERHAPIRGCVQFDR